MQPSQRIAAVLICPFIAWLGVACERTDTPTETRPLRGAFVVSSGPTTRWVNYDGDVFVGPGTSCENPGYKTVQAAVDDATPGAGDRINVCPGTYTEQVIISGPGKNNIRLRSTKQWAAVIKAPTVMVPDVGADVGKNTILRISSAQNVTILAFTITGPGPTLCGSLHYGVRIDNGGSANILGNHIRDIRDQYRAPPDPFAGEPSGCQNGMGVVVGGHSNDAAFSTGSARIEGNLVDKYQKNGVVVGGSGSSAVIAANRVFGFGPTSGIAQNGIEVLHDATAEIKHNFSSGHIYTPQAATPAGVLLIAAGNVDVDHNTVVRNDVDVYAYCSPGTPTLSLPCFFGNSSNPSSVPSVTHNRTRASTFDGIAVDLTNNAAVGENHSEQNGDAGIGLYEGALANTLEENQIERNGTNLSSTICPITDPPCFGGGILLHNASNNTVRGNHVRKNGTLNSVDNTDGIRVNMPSTANTIRGNHLRDNVTHDCHDASAGNTWVDNRGETSSPPQLCGEDRDDNDEVEAGWDRSYPWYSSYDGLATDYDWPSLYSAIDAPIQGLLDLLPQLGVGGVRLPSP